MFSTRHYLGHILASIVVIAFSFLVVFASDAQLDEDTIAGMWTFEEGKGKTVTLTFIKSCVISMFIKVL